MHIFSVSVWRQIQMWSCAETRLWVWLTGWNRVCVCVGKWRMCPLTVRAGVSLLRHSKQRSKRTWSRRSCGQTTGTDLFPLQLTAHNNHNYSHMTWGRVSVRTETQVDSTWTWDLDLFSQLQRQNTSPTFRQPSCWGSCRSQPPQLQVDFHLPSLWSLISDLSVWMETTSAAAENN